MDRGLSFRLSRVGGAVDCNFARIGIIVAAVSCWGPFARTRSGVVTELLREQRWTHLLRGNGAVLLPKA